MFYLGAKLHQGKVQTLISNLRLTFKQTIFVWTFCLLTIKQFLLIASTQSHTRTSTTRLNSQNQKSQLLYR